MSLLLQHVHRTSHIENAIAYAITETIMLYFCQFIFYIIKVYSVKCTKIQLVSVFSDKVQPNYLNTLYLYFSLSTLIYLKYRSFFFIFKCCLVFKLPVGRNLYIPHKLYFSEISPPQPLLPSCMLILNLILINYLLSFLVYL